MAKIISVRTSVKEDKTLGIFTVEGRTEPLFLTSKQVKAVCGIDRNFHLLKGGDLTVTFYKKDEVMGGSGGICTKDDTIIKEYSLEAPEKLSMLVMGATAGMSMFSM